MKRKWNRFLASLLCALMLGSEVAGAIPAAPATPAPAALPLVTDTGVQDNFRDEKNGRPNLFVSFLGDNGNYVYTAAGAHAGRNGAGGTLTKRVATSLNTISAPAPYDQSKYINVDGPGNTWAQYLMLDANAQNAPGTVFWIGIGVDRTQLWQLLESERGLTSLEAGFYYDSQVIEPYIDLGFLPAGVTDATATDEDFQAAYQATISKANINNPNYPANTQWGSNYTIVRALTEMDPPETDPVTREELNIPTIDNILDTDPPYTTLASNAGKSNWKMTYVSLELSDVESTAMRRRFQDDYKGLDKLPTGEDAEGNEVPIVPDGAKGDQYVMDGDASSGYDYNYLLLIPFRLKAYGTSDWTPLRLVRDATHFSIGGSTWGVDDYGAWERTTTRNPAVAAAAGDASTLGVEGHPARDLKLQTRFAGDINIFAPGRTAELEYDALLRIIGDGGSLNRAKLTVKGDPAVWPVWADTNGDVIGGLQSGQGMHLAVHTQDNYVATVTVTYVQDDRAGGSETIYHEYTQVASSAHDDAYEFVMPAFVPVGARRVTVTVTFSYQSGDNALIYLTMIPQPGDPDHAVGNEASIRTSLDVTYADTADTEIINSYSPTVDHPNYSHPGIDHPNTPMANAKKDQYVEIEVETHADYMAVVQIYDFRAQSFMTTGLTINAIGELGVVPDSTPIPNPAPGAGTGSIPATIPSGRIVMSKGGTIRLRMGSQDLDVIVTYEKGVRHQATLEVYNNNPAADDFDLNTAQLVYDLYDAYNMPSKAYSSVVYNDYDKDAAGNVLNDDHRAIKGTDKLPWVSASQATLSGSLGGDTGRTGKAWNPKDLPTPEDQVVGGRTVMALLAGATQKSDLQSGLSGIDLLTVEVGKGAAWGYHGIRKNAAGELCGDPDVSAALDADVNGPTVVDVLWEIRTQIDADTSTGGLHDTYLKTVTRPDTSVAYTYYDLTPAQYQIYLLEVAEAGRIKEENDLAYRIAFRRYQTVLNAYNAIKGISAYDGMKPVYAPAVNLSTSVSATTGLREFQDRDYKDVYLADYDQYLTDYEQYLKDLIASAGTGAVGAPTAPTSYPGATAPARKTIALKSATDADAALAAYAWAPAVVPTEVPNTDLGGNTIETREGRTVYIVMQADSAYELDTAYIDVFQRGSAPGYATGTRITTPAGVTPTPVPGYQNVYAFTMPNQDCVVRVSYKLRGTRKLNITYKGAEGLADNEAVVEAYSKAVPPAVTPVLSIITNKGYTSGTLPSGGSYNATTDVYTPDPVEGVFIGSVVTIRAKAADGYEIKSVEAKNSDSTVITVTKRQADDPADGDIYTFTVAQGRMDDIDLVITYGPEKEEEYTATIVGRTEGPINGANRATWYVVSGTTVTTPSIINNVRPNTHLVGHVSVAPEYYIKSVTARGASGNYPFTVTGNGYNNGYGTTLTGTDVPIEIFVDMPHENLEVEVVFAKGPPPPAPSNTLTLNVKDDENGEDLDPAKAAPNWARASVYDEKPANLAAATAEMDLPTVGALPGDVLGKNSGKGNGTLTDSKYVDAGKWVRVDFEAYVQMKSDTSPGAPAGAMVVDTDKSYYVSSVTVGPANLGVALIWEGPTSVSFYMPAGSAAVTVEFSKYPPNGRLPDYVLTVRETYTDLNPGAVAPPTTDQYSFITSARSETIGRWSQLQVSPGNYVPGRALDWNVNPEQVPPLNDPGLSATATGAATAGEEVTMTFDVDEGDGTAANPGWYYQSVVLISNGAATRLTDGVTRVSKTGTIATYQVKFHMPTSAAEFVVNYRKGPRPAILDYAFTLTLEDPDNVLDTGTNQWDKNEVAASFLDPTGANIGVHGDLAVGHTTPTASMTAVQHIHAGDIVTLKTTIADGYHLEYMIVNPAGLHIIPVWQDASTATFIMPTQGVAVAARVVKGPAQQYTANLILRYDGVMPAGKTIHDIGRGTFVLPDPSPTAAPGDTIGSLDNYAREAIYSTVQLPGDRIDYDLYAFDGYYIDRITIEPVVLGVTGSLSGSSGYQDGRFTMPHASVNVNVWFKSGWPDEIPYDLTIRVHDSSLDPSKTLNPNDNNYAALRTVTGRVPAPVVASGDTDEVYGGQVKVIDADDYPLDRDTVIVDVVAQPGFHVDASTIKVADSRGNLVSWWYVPGGIAFTQPPRSVTVDVTFRQGDPDPASQRTATLHLSGYSAGDTSADSAILNDYVLLSAQAGNTRPQTATQASGTTAPPAAVNTDGAVITKLYHGDILDLSAMPGADRHISSAYAVTPGGTVIPIYGYDAGGTLTAARAQFVPGHPGTVTPAAAGTAVEGAFAMPESDVDVYVKFDGGLVGPNDLPVNLVVSGAAGSGDAEAVIDEPDPTADQSMSVTAPGMDTRFTAQGNETVVTFRPDTAAGYDIVGLEVTNNVTGAHVPYSWISVLQDPPTAGLTNTNVWSGTAPAPGITHPTWKPNPDKQIRLNVPSGGVTVHVTYGKVSTIPFKAQVVVNDPLAGTAVTSRNNAWLSQQAGTDVDDAVLKKIQMAVPGEWVDLDITVHPGFRIEYVKVVPQSYGIVPNLPVGTDMGTGVTYYLHDQKTGFVMPGGDCTVYVKFVADGIAPKSATLIVNGAPTGNNLNNATINSPASGTKGPVYVGGTPQSVTARPGVDWVTSDYYWDTATSAVAAISVTAAGTGASVPFSQVVDPGTGHGQITFPMSSSDVIVTITYQADRTPVGQEVVLHVIDKDKLRDSTKPAIEGDPDGNGQMENYGQLIYDGNGAINAAPADTGTIAPGVRENRATIYVPAGQTVNVIACSDDQDLDGLGPVYIESAYVLFEQNGQMVHFNLTPDSLTTAGAWGYTGLHDESSFTVHPGRNDVYVTLTRKAPVADEHAAVLMIRSPSADISSEAGIHADQTTAVWNDADPALRDKVRANDPSDSHAYVVTKDGNKVTINVEPANGYIIDYVQITPLGFPLDSDPVYHYTRTGNTITFDMPHCNVAITVYLKRGSDQNFTAKLHFVQDPNCLSVRPPQEEDYAKLSWTPDGQATKSIWADAKPTGSPAGAPEACEDESEMIVKEGSTLTLDVTLDRDPGSGESDVILAAFAVWKDRGAIVRLTPTYPAGRTVLDGLEGVTESASGFDNTVPDGTATLTMPMGDVEIYVVVTTTPPTDPWHTVALVATDHSPTENNSGKNKGELWNNTTPTDVREAKSDSVSIAWLTVLETETFSVLPKPLAGYYSFVPPAVMTGNDGTSRNLTPLYSNYLYEVSSIRCNQVVRIDFESSDELELTVEIEDPDNPGNGKVEQEVVVDPAGTTPPTLRLTSTSVAGSYQIIQGVTPGGTVELAVKPHDGLKPDGYKAYAQLFMKDGTVTNLTLTDADGDGVWEGDFAMPPNNTRVVVTFYKEYKGTLTLINRINGDATGQATMKEDKRGLAPLNVHSLNNSATYDSLPNGTRLDAQVTSDMTGRTVTGLLTVNGSTTLLPAVSSGKVGDPDHFYHTINRADAEITLVLDSPTEHPNSYIAAVRTVNMPAGTAAPTIRDDTHTTQTTGSIWTTADSTDNVIVHATVPSGYRVDVAAVRTDTGAAVSIAPVPLTADGDAAFTMPAANVQVTLTYVKVEFKLTLKVVDTSGAPAGNVTSLTATSNVVSGGPTLTADGQSMTVRKEASVDLSATPSTGAVSPAVDPHVVGVYYQSADGGIQWLQPSALGAGVAYSRTGAFAMPDADTTVTVIYDKEHTPGPTPTPDEPYYIATVEVDPDGEPGNRAVSLVNLPDAGLPADSPDWAAGYPGSEMKVSYEVAAGYYVTITARRADNDDPIVVLQMGSGTNGTGSITMPAANVIITLKYSTEKPTSMTNPVALQLLRHEAKAGNKAVTTNAADLTELTGLATNGTSPLAPHAPAYTSPTDPVETMDRAAALGDDLRTLANWEAGSQVVRMTVAVRKVTRLGGVVTDIQETPEVELLTSKYADAATSRVPTPVTNDPDKEIVIRVYYGNIYSATFHLVGDDPTDDHSATDVDSSPTGGGTLAYTSAYDSSNAPLTKPITNDLDRFEGYQGNGFEDIRTTATAGAGRRVVGVVYESDLYGAVSAIPDGTGRYDFTMPPADVDFYAIYEPEPADPKDKTYIAKVALDSDSQPIAGTQNAVSIANSTNTAAAKGKYWVGAKGGDSIAVTVKVAPGYQARITQTCADDLPAGSHTHPYDYYISRTVFVPNLPLGKGGEFTMPVDSDATVTVKFIKGYDLKLAVKDTSGKADDTASPALVNKATLTTAETPARKVEGASGKPNGSVINYTQTPAVAQDQDTVKAIDGGVSIETDVSPADPAADKYYKVYRHTPFTGTTRLDAGTATNPYAYDMPSENVEETVLFYNADTPLLAKVELKGDSDINGNAATPIIDYTDRYVDTVDTNGDSTPDAPAKKTASGTVWTTTYLDNAAGALTGHTIDLTLTVAKGYVAKITVRWDDDDYDSNPSDASKWNRLDAATSNFQQSDAGEPSGFKTITTPNVTEVQIGYQQGTGLFGNNISDPQHFRFTMPEYDVYDTAKPATDVTVIVEFVRSTDIPQPFDPRNDETKTPDFLEQGFIYGENRGDFAIVEIPTLAKDESETVKKLYDTDNYTAPPDAAEDTNKDVTFEFYLRTVANDGTETYTRLDLGVDIELEPYDPDELRAAGDPYNYYKGKGQGMWSGTETWKDTTAGAQEYDFVGSKFKLIPTQPVTTGTGATAVTARTANAQKVYDMLNNQGSLETYTDKNGKTQYRTQLFVMAKDAIGGESAYTQVWIRPWFALGVKVSSYAPTHDLEGELYRLMTQTELDVATGYLLPDGITVNPAPPAGVTASTPVDPDNPQHYRWDKNTKPFAADSVVLEEEGSGKWLQILRIRSSELLGSYDKDYDPSEDPTATPPKTLLDNVKVPAGERLTYALRIKKLSNLTYTRVNIDLDPNSPDYAAPKKPLTDYYERVNGVPDYKTRTFMLTDTIQLIAGDVDQNGKTKIQDYDAVYDFVYRSRTWTDMETEPTKPAATVPSTDSAWGQYDADMRTWSTSIYNPESMAYRCDLDGDRRLTVVDLNIVNTRFNYNRDEKDYYWYYIENDEVKKFSWPFGLGPRDQSQYNVSLFGLETASEGELLADAYWDELVDPAQTLAVPMETYCVDAEGNFWLSGEEPERAPVATGPEQAETHDEHPETPLGEEALDHQAVLPGVSEEAAPAPEDRKDSAAGSGDPPEETREEPEEDPSGDGAG